MSKTHTIQISVTIHGSSLDRYHHKGAKISKEQASRASELSETALIELLERLVGGHKPKA